TDAGAINTGGSGITIERNSITQLYDRGWDVGVGTVQALYLDIGTYHATVSDNNIDQVDVAARLNCQGRNSVEGNTIGNVFTQRIAVTFAGDCTGFLSGTSRDYMVGLMENAGCTNIGTASESCACFATGNCATDSLVQM